MVKYLSSRGAFFLLIVAWLGIQSAFGQKQFNFTTLTTKNGLSSNTINVILQDRDGLIWFGTSDGLNKYDGTNVTVYNHIQQDTSSIPANEILSLLEDRSGKLWVGTAGRLVYYDSKHSSFVPYKGNKSGQYPTNVRSLYQDHLGRIWAGCYGSFKIIRPETGDVETIDITHLLSSSSEFLVALCFFEDDQHQMWIGTNGGLLRYNPVSKKFAVFVKSPSDQKSISGADVRAIVQDRQGHLFFGTDNGLSMLMPDGKSFRAFHHSDMQPASISSDVIYSAAFTPEGELWLGTEEGISIFDCNNYTAENIRPNRRQSFGLSHKAIKSICMAQRGIVWLGTYQGGVNKYDPNLALFNLKRSNPFDPKGLSSPAVTSFAENKDGRIFIGTDGGGLHLFDRNTGLFEHCKIESKINHSDHALPILAMDMDPKNKLWIGTFQNGLFTYDPSTGQYKQYLAGPSNRELSQNDIFFVQHDHSGLIWIGTNGCGADIYNPQTGTFFRCNRHPQNKDDLSLPLNGFMRAMAEDKHGDVWLGSIGTGIAVFHPGSRSFTLYNKSNSNLSDDAVLSIYHDRAGSTWVGTNGGGLNLFDKKNGKFTQLNESNGLANGIIYKILEDNTGLLWVSTDKGISSIDPQTKKIKNFSRSNGVQDSPFILGAGLVTSSRELFFGGQDGFNYFLPGTLPANDFMPPVLLTELRVANNTVIPGENSPIDEQISSAKDIRLPYGQNFSISYVALNYTTPQQNHYSYKLMGLDRDWNFVRGEKTAHYTNLDPGDYTFEVRASNNEGVWNTQSTTISVHVLPPIWRTSYAYLLYIVALGGLLLYWRQRSIQKIKNRLELQQEKINAQRLIEQRRAEAERIHELDQQKIKFLTNLSHEFRTPISLILAPADKLFATTKDQAVTGQVNLIRRNARRLLNLVNQLLDFRKMEEQELKLKLSPGDLVAFVREAAESFQDLSERKKITLIIKNSVESLYTTFDHDKIERIIFNLLSNAFKFTDAGGEVCIETSVAENNHEYTFCITISDTGIGINPELKDRIFDRFFMENTHASILNQGSGIGLSIVKEFIQLHGGEITVESNPGHGSVFRLGIPVTHTGLDLTPDTHANQDLPVNAEEKPERIQEDKMPTILLVEDNEEFRFYLKDSLQSFYHIIEAGDGKEGWQKALAHHPQLVVSDISMPYMDGIELSQKIKSDKRTNHIPVILLTAISGEENQIKGLESGANDYLTKPFNFEILNTRIKNLLLYNRSLKNTYTRQIQVNSKEIEIESNDARLLNAIVKYIDDKLNDPDLSVEDLSKHVGMSRGSLYHKVLQLTGQTPIEYIRSIKLDRAATLLEKSDYNVAQIAYMTGFGTPSYFSRLFKAMYNVLPSEYINLKRKDSKWRSENVSD